MKNMPPKRDPLLFDSDSNTSNTLKYLPADLDELMRMKKKSNPDPFLFQTRFQLPKFVGKMNGEVVDSWIHRISPYFRNFTFLTKEMKLQILSLQLEGLAQTWWDTQLENTTLVVDIGSSEKSSELPIKTWAQFFQDLRDLFNPPKYLHNLWI
jgi:hypothetical protein